MPCGNRPCIGGEGFDIRGVLFCSPSCGNEYFNLESDDTDYWPEDESDEDADDQETYNYVDASTQTESSDANNLYPSAIYVDCEMFVSQEDEEDDGPEEDDEDLENDENDSTMYCDLNNSYRGYNYHMLLEEISQCGGDAGDFYPCEHCSTSIHFWDGVSWEDCIPCDNCMDPLLLCGDCKTHQTTCPKCSNQ
jgi:hypothetical protein